MLYGRRNVENFVRAIWQRTGLTKSKCFGLMEPGGGVQIPTAALPTRALEKGVRLALTYY